MAADNILAALAGVSEGAASVLVPYWQKKQKDQTDMQNEKYKSDLEQARQIAVERAKPSTPTYLVDSSGNVTGQVDGKVSRQPSQKVGIGKTAEKTIAELYPPGTVRPPGYELEGMDVLTPKQANAILSRQQQGQGLNARLTTSSENAAKRLGPLARITNHFFPPKSTAAQIDMGGARTPYSGAEQTGQADSAENWDGITPGKLKWRRVQ